MVSNVCLSPQVSSIEPKTKNKPNFEGSTVPEKKEDNSDLLYGSLAVLSAFGLGMLVRKPKVVSQKTVKEAAAKADEVAENVGNVTKPKKRKIYRSDARKMNKTEAKSHRKKEKLEIEQKWQSEIDEQFSEQELATYKSENGYIAPNKEQRKGLNKLEEQNALERSQKNTIGENAKGVENLSEDSNNGKVVKPLVIKAQNPELKALSGTIKNLEKRIAGAKRFGKDTSTLEAQLAKLIEKRNNLTQELNQAA